MRGRVARIPLRRAAGGWQRDRHPAGPRRAGSAGFPLAPSALPKFAAPPSRNFLIASAVLGSVADGARGGVAAGLSAPPPELGLGFGVGLGFDSDLDLGCDFGCGSRGGAARGRKRPQSGTMTSAVTQTGETSVFGA